jgi:NTP pyrophosphatase (non-canonical NTP hydrolase)
MGQITNLVKASHYYAKRNGFYNKELNVAEKLMLIVSELGEALEAWRMDQKIIGTPSFELIEALENGNVDEKHEAFIDFQNCCKDNFSDEIADTLIRIFDLCGALKIPIEGCIRAKMAYNEMRPYKHNKQF